MTNLTPESMESPCDMQPEVHCNTANIAPDIPDAEFQRRYERSLGSRQHLHYRLEQVLDFAIGRRNPEYASAQNKAIDSFLNRVNDAEWDEAFMGLMQRDILDLDFATVVKEELAAKAQPSGGSHEVVNAKMYLLKSKLKMKLGMSDVGQNAQQMPPPQRSARVASSKQQQPQPRAQAARPQNQPQVGGPQRPQPAPNPQRQHTPVPQRQQTPGPQREQQTPDLHCQQQITKQITQQASSQQIAQQAPQQVARQVSQQVPGQQRPNQRSASAKSSNTDADMVAMQQASAAQYAQQRARAGMSQAQPIIRSSAENPIDLTGDTPVNRLQTTTGATSNRLMTPAELGSLTQPQPKPKAAPRKRSTAPPTTPWKTAAGTIITPPPSSGEKRKFEEVSSGTESPAGTVQKKVKAAPKVTKTPRKSAKKINAKKEQPQSGQVIQPQGVLPGPTSSTYNGGQWQQSTPAPHVGGNGMSVHQLRVETDKFYANSTGQQVANTATQSYAQQMPYNGGSPAPIPQMGATGSLPSNTNSQGWGPEGDNQFMALFQSSMVGQQDLFPASVYQNQQLSMSAQQQYSYTNVAAMGQNNSIPSMSGQMTGQQIPNQQAKNQQMPSQQAMSQQMANQQMMNQQMSNQGPVTQEMINQQTIYQQTAGNMSTFGHTAAHPGGWQEKCRRTLGGAPQNLYPTPSPSVHQQGLQTNTLVQSASMSGTPQHQQTSISASQMTSAPEQQNLFSAPSASTHQQHSQMTSSLQSGVMNGTPQRQVSRQATPSMGTPNYSSTPTASMHQQVPQMTTSMHPSSKPTRPKHNDPKIFVKVILDDGSEIAVPNVYKIDEGDPYSDVMSTEWGPRTVKTWRRFLLALGPTLEAIGRAAPMDLCFDNV